KLEHDIVPLYYGRRQRYVEIMRMAIALNGSFFNTQRMVQQYVANAYMGRNNSKYPLAPEPTEAASPTLPATASVTAEGK
ncbi:MAG TPA: hypothetical protein VFP40_08755, partial [Terriglobales bacterium]|nr:hypothetical protein [Terriglobales bacterium]